ncbi:hypothetical protein ISF_06766 [Cordyceps fumosorosea ARSEF 2679]|uniref:Uncharacterized protein n=1 Tax=Cordyceps fumosorosea (strain ARSEF 2679) TaxID=1081104 RepID=A0A167R2Z2_CORFA|nr:hypothetical protein ISF_06766 [Cordyceps fumosorosea ARSEF 2679]OAA58227.1 hypothetical protein ISF_06766 [Cordyceps fumosorosea ARSEF 2679]
MVGRKRILLNDENGQVQGSEMQSRKATLHLENQERAYVAASRRADRSLEARYQSAVMASRVHQKRTGKALRVTYQIVHDEDMYEEDDPVLSGSWNQPQEQRHRGSPHAAYRSRAASQTDAFISALIARKAGMPNYFGLGHALPASTTSGNGQRAEQQQPPPPPPPIGHGIPSDGIDCLADCSPVNPSAASLGGGGEFSFDACFAELAAFPGVAPHAPTSSGGSSSPSDDNPAYEPNYILGTGSEEQSFSPGAANLWLEDFVVDGDNDGGLHRTPYGLSLG